MATPSLQDVLGAVPAVGAAIDEMTEIIPGVPSNERTLEELLKGLDEQCVRTEESRTDVWYNMFINPDYDEDSDGEEIEVGRHIELTMFAPKTDANFCRIHKEEYEATPKGLMEAITDGKRVMKRYREDGLCTECATPQRKRLRGAGLPYCSPCVIKKALQ